MSHDYEKDTDNTEQTITVSSHSGDFFKDNLISRFDRLISAVEQVAEQLSSIETQLKDIAQKK